MDHYKKSLNATISLLALCALPYAVQAESLATMLRQLTETHPRILSQQELIASATEAETEAFSGYLPKFDLNGTIGRENTDRTKLLVAAGKFNLEPTIGGASITQNIFEGFGTQGAVASASASKQLSELTTNATIQQVFFEAASSYISVLRQIKLTTLSKRNMDTLQQQLNLEDEKVQRGSGIAVDVLQAKSRLQISKERYTAFMGGLRDAIARYTQVFGTPPVLEDMELPIMPEQHIPATVEEAISIAIENNPALLASKQSAEVAAHQKTLARTGYFPKFDVVASSNYRDDAGGIQGTEISNSVVLQGTWQLFSGFADQSRVKQATHDHQAALAESIDAKRRIEEEVRLAWSNLTISKERADLLQNAVNIAGEVYDARKRLRDAGSDTALNVLDAENELFRAQIDEAAARYGYYEAVYRLLMAMGILNLAHI